MNKVKQASAVIVGLLCLATLPATAQKNGKALGKAVEATVGRKVAQQTVKVPYSPIFGYNQLRIKVPETQRTFINTTVKEAPAARFINTAFSNYSVTKEDFINSSTTLVQVAPVTNSKDASGAFVEFNYMTAPQITQASYLWSLAHPNKSFVVEGGRLQEKAQQTIDEGLGYDDNKYDVNIAYTMHEINEYPNLLFLQRLVDKNFTPKSYARLVKETTVYPKHIELNAQGFPVPTAQAAQARDLDLYLMLSNPKEMRYHDNTGSDYYSHGRYYTPFVLTQEEKAAANQLLALRQVGAQIPENPTPRQLLALAYNELAADMVPYYDLMVDYDSMFWRNTSTNTALNKAIKKMLTQAKNTPEGESYDIAHLTVVNAILGNVSRESEKDLVAALKAFRKLRAETPNTPENVKHLARLREILPKTTAFWDFGKGHTYEEGEFEQLNQWKFEDIQDLLKVYTDPEEPVLIR